MAKPQQIKTLAQLSAAMQGKKAVHCPTTHCFAKPLPAAFALNMSGSVLHRLMSCGMFVYEKKGKGAKWKL